MTSRTCLLEDTSPGTPARSPQQARRQGKADRHLGKIPWGSTASSRLSHGPCREFACQPGSSDDLVSDDLVSDDLIKGTVDRQTLRLDQGDTPLMPMREHSPGETYRGPREAPDTAALIPADAGGFQRAQVTDDHDRVPR